MRLKATQWESAGALDGRRGAAAAMARTLARWAAGALLALPALAARAGFPQFLDGYDKFENTLQFDGNLLKRYVFRTRASSEQVRTFYREALAEQGWKEAGPDEAELLGTLLKIPEGDVLSFKNEDVRVSIVIMSAPGMNDRVALVNVMFPWAMQGGMGRLGDGNALYPSGKATLRLNQPVGEGRVLFEQAECAEAPALVVPYAVNRLLEQGWRRRARWPRWPGKCALLTRFVSCPGMIRSSLSCPRLRRIRPGGCTLLCNTRTLTSARGGISRSRPAAGARR